MRVTVPGTRAVNMASPSGVACTVAVAITALSSSPVPAAETAICEAVMACGEMASVSRGPVLVEDGEAGEGRRCAGLGQFRGGEASVAAAARPNVVPA
jgi:hypothetical protein